MEYSTRNEILPVYFQIGYPSLFHGLSVGEAEPLDYQPISALHYHHCLEFGICYSGTGEMHIENRIYRFAPGDISYVGRNVPHFSKADNNVESKWLWIFLDILQLSLEQDDSFIARLTDLAERGYSGVFHMSEHTQLAELIQKLKANSKRDSFSGLETALLAGQILIESARIGDIDKNKNRLKLSEKLKPALLFIRNNYMDPQKMSEETIAANCGLSVSQFRKLFRQDVGIPLPQYINNTRMSSAVHLICNTDKKMLSIALESGFNDISYFNKLFRKSFGITPKEMRNRKYKQNDLRSSTTHHLNPDGF